MGRFIGFDAHKSYAYVVELRDGEKQEYRVSIPSGLPEFKERLDKTVHLVLEASTNSFRLADELTKHVGRLVVADPAQTRGAASTAAVTDRTSAEALARLLASDFVRPVWIPPQEIRNLRNLVELRVKLARMRVGASNRLKALLRQELVATGPGRARLVEATVKEAIGQEPTLQAFCSTLFRLRDQLEEENKKVDVVLNEWSRKSDAARLIMSIPGVGPIVAACVVAQVGDIKRFSSAAKLCSYAGLVPRVHMSGQSRRSGGITRTGRRSLRWAMGLAAMSSCRVAGPVKLFKEKLSERRPKAVAMTACARKLLSLVWHVWNSGKPFQDRKNEENQEQNQKRHDLKLRQLDRKPRKKG
jgi:transposase